LAKLIKSLHHSTRSNF